MVKHTQTIRRLLVDNCLSVFDHFVGLACEGLICDVLRGLVSYNPKNMKNTHGGMLRCVTCNLTESIIPP